MQEALLTCAPLGEIAHPKFSQCLNYVALSLFSRKSPCFASGVSTHRSRVCVLSDFTEGCHLAREGRNWKVSPWTCQPVPLTMSNSDPRGPLKEQQSVSTHQSTSQRLLSLLFKSANRTCRGHSSHLPSPVRLEPGQHGCTHS